MVQTAIMRVSLLRRKLMGVTEDLCERVARTAESKGGIWFGVIDIFGKPLVRPLSKKTLVNLANSGIVDNTSELVYTSGPNTVSRSTLFEYLRAEV